MTYELLRIWCRQVQGQTLGLTDERASPCTHLDHDVGAYLRRSLEDLPNVGRDTTNLVYRAFYS